jgi:hypothetical protein
LNAVYQGAGLPAVKDPAKSPVGERRMSADRELQAVVADLHQSHEIEP